jgi:hypothetical protein
VLHPQFPHWLVRLIEQKPWLSESPFWGTTQYLRITVEC